MESTLDVAQRWQMGPEARALVILTGVLLAFGLATVYSASAIVEMQAGYGHAHLLVRQVLGMAVGIVLFAVVAKIDAEVWEKWAWPIMIASLFLLLVVILPFTVKIAPRVHGSRRYLFGSSLQPSELAKLAVVIWASMLVIKKGETLRRLTKGLLPFLVVIGALDVLVMLEPDLSTAMMFTLVLGIILFAGGVRIGHFVALGVLLIPLLYVKIERLNYVLLRMSAFFDPGAAPEVNYQLRQSLIAVGSGQIFGVGFGRGRQQYGFLPFGYDDFIAASRFCALCCAGFQDCAEGAHAIPATGGGRPHGDDGAHRVSSYRRGNRLASNDRTDAAIHFVRPIKSGAISRHDRNSRQHWQLARKGISRSEGEPACIPRASRAAMRVIFAAGGTGGHLYPGLAIARALKRADPRVEPFFIGARRGIERDVLPQVGFAFELLDLHPLYRSRPWANWKTVRGATTAWRMIGAEVRSEPPACVVGTGGYAAGLALAYATAHRIPFVLQESNTYPGITARFFSRFAAQVHLGFPEARRYISPGKSTEVFDTGNPVEPPPPDAGEKAPSRAKWGFPASGGRVLLVYGGSQGSQAMNRVVAEWIERGLSRDLFVIWATGRANYERLAHYESAQVKVRGYIAPLDAAGAAEMIKQSELTVDRLSSTVESLISNPAKLARMRQKALERARPTAAADIAAHILDLIARQQPER